METNLISLEQAINNLDSIIIKKYLPFAFKKKMIENIIETCTSIDENGVLYVDSILKKMAYEYSIVNQYSNIDLSDKNIIETYDILKENNIVSYVFNEINLDELQFIKKCLDEQINHLLTINNSIENLVAKGLTKIINKLPDEKGLLKLIKELPKQFDKINPDKLKYVSEVIGWSNGVKK